MSFIMTFFGGGGFSYVTGGTGGGEVGVFTGDGGLGGGGKLGRPTILCGLFPACLIDAP